MRLAVKASDGGPTGRWGFVAGPHFPAENAQGRAILQAGL